MEMNTKSGIKPVQVNFYNYSEADVTEHLQNRILGFPGILVDYERWDGVYGNAYVRMRVCLPFREVATQVATGNDFVSRTLREDGAAVGFKEEVLDVLKPYMYPKTLSNLFQDPEMMRILTEKGIDAVRLEELIRFSKPQLSRDATGDYFCIYLQPEQVLRDMTVSTDTGKLEGVVNVISVRGGRDQRTGASEPIRWGVQQDLRSSAINTGSATVTVDELFRRI